GFQDIGTYSTVPTSDVATCLAFAIAFRLDRFASWLGDRIINSFESKAEKFEMGPPSACFYFAFLEFVSLWGGKNFKVKDYGDDPLGVYDDILGNWNNEKGYLKACLEACDYHVNQMNNEEGYSEFLAAPEDLLPIEMLMIRRIRE